MLNSLGSYKVCMKKNACESPWETTALLVCVMCGPVVLASPASLLEKQNAKSHSRNTEFESAIKLSPQVIHTHFELERYF